MSDEPLTIAKSAYRICLSDIQRRLLTLIVQELTKEQVDAISDFNRDYNELSGSGSNNQTIHSKVLHHLITHTLISHALIINGPTNLVTPSAFNADKDQTKAKANASEPELRELYTTVHEKQRQLHAQIFDTEITPISSIKKQMHAEIFKASTTPISSTRRND